MINIHADMLSDLSDVAVVTVHNFLMPQDLVVVTHEKDFSPTSSSNQSVAFKNIYSLV